MLGLTAFKNLQKVNCEKVDNRCDNEIYLKPEQGRDESSNNKNRKVEAPFNFLTNWYYLKYVIYHEMGTNSHKRLSSNLLSKNTPTLRIGDRIANDRFIIKQKLGEGRFAVLYSVFDTHEHRNVALKMERQPNQRLAKQEYKIMHRLGPVCRQVCQVFFSSYHEDHFFFTMELLGLNLVQFTQSQLSNIHTDKLTTTKALSTSLLSALSSIHQEGFHHRDIKPANIVLRPQQEDKKGDLNTTITPTTTSSSLECILIDFGLARRFIDDDGIRLPERHDVPFKGSSTYASLYALQECDQGPRDDLWGWFYLTVELVTGSLPWRFKPDDKGDDNGNGNGNVTNTNVNAANQDNRDKERYSKTEMIGLKSKYIESPAALVLSSSLGEDSSIHPPPPPCPRALVDINRYLKTLSFDDDIDYDLLKKYVDRLDDPKYIIIDGDDNGDKDDDQSLSPRHVKLNGVRDMKEQKKKEKNDGNEIRPRTARSRSRDRYGRNRNGEEERSRKRREDSRGREREKDRGGGGGGRRRRWYGDNDDTDNNKDDSKKKRGRRSRSRSRSASRRRTLKREGGRDDQRRKKKGRRGGRRSRSRSRSRSRGDNRGRGRSGW
jgi:serine/threonine protein kinase